MVETDELQNIIGTEEVQRYKPAKVDIKTVEIIEVGAKKYPKVVCNVKHPDYEELIQLSSIEYINPNSKKVENSGLFINKDSEGKIRKNSALASFMNLLDAKTILELSNKDGIETITGSSGYLAFKSY